MPWKSALNNLDFFYLMFDRSEVYGPLQVGRSHPQRLSRGLQALPQQHHGSLPCGLPCRLTSGNRWNLCLITTKLQPGTGQMFQLDTWTSEYMLE